MSEHDGFFWTRQLRRGQWELTLYRNCMMDTEVSQSAEREQMQQYGGQDSPQSWKPCNVMQDVRGAEPGLYKRSSHLHAIARVSLEENSFWPLWTQVQLLSHIRLLPILKILESATPSIYHQRSLCSETECSNKWQWTRFLAQNFISQAHHIQCSSHSTDMLERICSEWFRPLYHCDFLEIDIGP